MYNNPYYQSAYQQAFANTNPYQQQVSQPQQTRVEVVRVNGKNGAEAYQLAPNSSILLLDESAPLIWLKTTDGAGYPTVTPYTITPYQPEPPVDMKSLEDRISRLEAIFNEKSNSRNTKRKSGDAAEPVSD